MPQKFRGLQNIPSLVADEHRVSHGTSPTPNSAGGVSMEKFSRPPQWVRLRLTAAVLSMTAANDYGSLKLADLPNANLQILGAKFALTATMAGFASNVGTALDVALGTVATASAAFSNAGEKDLIPKVDATGAGATATIAGAGTSTEAEKFIAAGTNAVYLNASSPVTSGTGTLTITGYVDLLVQYHH